MLLLFWLFFCPQFWWVTANYIFIFHIVALWVRMASENVIEFLLMADMWGGGWHKQAHLIQCKAKLGMPKVVGVGVFVWGLLMLIKDLVIKYLSITTMILIGIDEEEEDSFPFPLILIQFKINCLRWIIFISKRFTFIYCLLNIFHYIH